MEETNTSERIRLLEERLNVMTSIARYLSTKVNLTNQTDRELVAWLYGEGNVHD